VTGAHAEAPFEPKAPAVIAVDVGGSHVKVLLWVEDPPGAPAKPD
jgi:hypothetical protein